MTTIKVHFYQFQKLPCDLYTTNLDSWKMWLATGRLVTVWWKMPSLGPRLQQPLTFWVWLSLTCLSSSSGVHGGGERPIHSQLALLWYSLNTLFCELAKLCVRAFTGMGCVCVCVCVCVCLPLW